MLEVDVGVDPNKSTGVDLVASSRVESSRLPLAQSTSRRMSKWLHPKSTTNISFAYFLRIKMDGNTLLYDFTIYI